MVTTKCNCMYFILAITLTSAAYTPCNMHIDFADLENYIERLVDAQVQKKLTNGEFVRRDDVETLIETKVAEREIVLRKKMEATIIKKLDAKGLNVLKKLIAEFQEKVSPGRSYQNLENKTKTENYLNREFFLENETKSTFAVRDSTKNGLMKEQVEKERTNQETTQRNYVEIKQENKKEVRVKPESPSDELLIEEKRRKLQGIVELTENRRMDSRDRNAKTREIRHTMYNSDRSFKRLALNVVHQVGFTACITSDVITIGDTHTVVFDRVVSNIGGAYHYHTGIFIAPVKGMYVFHLSATSSPNRAQQLGFVKDDVEVSPVFPNAVGTNTYQTAGCQWVIELEQGSEVWIRTKGAGQIFGQCFTLFSGFLLSKIE